jgi:hypothetical protein
MIKRPYGKINKGHTIPYGTLVGASRLKRTWKDSWAESLGATKAAKKTET